MSIRAIVTRGFGAGGSIPLLVTRGYLDQSVRSFVYATINIFAAVAGTPQLLTTTAGAPQVSPAVEGEPNVNLALSGTPND